MQERLRRFIRRTVPFERRSPCQHSKEQEHSDKNKDSTVFPHGPPVIFLFYKGYEGKGSGESLAHARGSIGSTPTSWKRSFRWKCPRVAGSFLVKLFGRVLKGSVSKRFGASPLSNRFCYGRYRSRIDAALHFLLSRREKLPCCLKKQH